jgi:hypothetical protein
VARARDLSNGVTISPETAHRMKAYFDRHEIDKQGKGWSSGEDGFPSNGRIAWALWGSDPGWAWSRKLVEQMNAADEEGRSIMGNIERRALAIDEVESAVPLLAVESRSAEDGSEREYIVGYAAKFGVNSLDLGDFIERIHPDAFGIVSERRGRKKSLETRALWNHDANYPLARYPGTLSMSVDDAVEFFEAHGSIHHALRLLQDVGLGYLTLGQQSPTLSGGEAQRVKLVTELAKVRIDSEEAGARPGRAGVARRTLYVLDEPTVGLHMADVEKLVVVLHRLVDAGNTVLVIEHNLDVMCEADWILDLGPEGGSGGGHIVATGLPWSLQGDGDASHTASAINSFLASRPQRPPS